MLNKWNQKYADGILRKYPYHSHIIFEILLIAHLKLKLACNFWNNFFFQFIFEITQ